MPHRVRGFILFMLLAGALACQPRERPAASASGSQWRGAAVTPPIPRPDFTLTATDGTPFDFRAETEGYLTLVFFGYTYCPDICPVHMANLGAVIGAMPPSAQRRIRVVFVTTDPERDTPERLRTWLNNFHRDFIGLTGPLDSINRIQRSIGLAPAMQGPVEEDGGYEVGHAAQVIAFGPDGPARLVYPFGIRQADWAHDLPRLLTQGPSDD